VKTIITSNYRYAVCTVFSLLVSLDEAQTSVIINAKSALFADVESAVSHAAPGDTVIIPPGTARWTQTLAVDKGITIQGATTIAGDHTTTMSSNDQTIISDDVPIRGAAGTAMVIDFLCDNGQSGRISGITFSQGTRTATPNWGGIRVRGASNQFRLDHCHFDNLCTGNLTVSGNIYGVIDHCIFNETVFATAIAFCNGGGAYGDEAWTQPAQFGTANFMFVEDCIFSWLGNPGTQNACGLDSYRGGRYAARYCTFNNAKPNTHGTESSGRMRSSRAIEIYGNKLNWTRGYSPTGGQLRGGGLLIHNNTYTNYASGYGLRVYREFGSFLFPAADGTSQWDQNALQDGSPAPDGTEGHLFFRGKHDGADRSTILSDSTATFSNLTGYVVRNMGNNNALRWNSWIGSNAPTTATLSATANSSPTSNLAYIWNRGDVYEIRKVLVALDQPGRGKGDLVTGDKPVNCKTGRATWPHQALEPAYSWNNTNNGSNINIGSYGEPTLREGRDYYNNTSMPGYTPYVYPHPLTRGLPPPKQTTRNAAGDSQHDQHKKRRPWGAKKSKKSPTNEMAEDQENVGN
jgi:hypothetical protein